jgi:hypothetical protein
LASSDVLNARVDCGTEVGGICVLDWLTRFLKHPRDVVPPRGKYSAVLDELLRSAVDRAAERDLRVPAGFRKRMDRQVEDAVHMLGHELRGAAARCKWAYLLLEALAIGTSITWRYEYHLGAFGLYQLFERMVAFHKGGGRDLRGFGLKPKSRTPIFIVGELPEELTSYRHGFALWLNAARVNAKHDGSPLVRALTGDIGLHIGLGVSEESRRAPLVRCTFCNYNNETLCRRGDYHDPMRIVETPVKRLSGAMVYLCLEHEHWPGRVDVPEYFISRPEVRAT